MSDEKKFFIGFAIVVFLFITAAVWFILGENESDNQLLQVCTRLGGTFIETYGDTNFCIDKNAVYFVE